MNMSQQSEGPTVSWGAPGPALPAGEGRGCPALLCEASSPLGAAWVPQQNKNIKEHPKEGNIGGERSGEQDV